MCYAKATTQTYSNLNCNLNFDTCIFFTDKMVNVPLHWC